MRRLLCLRLVGCSYRPNQVHDHRDYKYSHGRKQTEEYEARFGKRSAGSAEEKTDPQAGRQDCVLKRSSARGHAQNFSEPRSKTAACAIAKPK
jgi:hypothetical protein